MKETIIFLHGIVGDQGVFKLIREQLKDQYNCIFYDFYYTKNQEVDFPLSLELLLEELDDQFSINGVEKAHLCSFSFGSMPAIAYAEKHPEKVASLTLIGGYYCKVPSEFNSNIVRVLEERHDCVYEKWLEKCANSLNPNKKQLPEDSESIFVRCAHLLHVNVLEKVLRLQLTFDSRKKLCGMKTPILWVMGEFDSLYKETLIHLKEDIPHVEYIELKNAGHAAHIHQPEQFMMVFQSFLEKNKRNESAACN